MDFNESIRHLPPIWRKYIEIFLKNKKYISNGKTKRIRHSIFYYNKIKNSHSCEYIDWNILINWLFQKTPIILNNRLKYICHLETLDYVESFLMSLHLLIEEIPQILILKIFQNVHHKYRYLFYRSLPHQYVADVSYRHGNDSKQHSAFIKRVIDFTQTSESTIAESSISKCLTTIDSGVCKDLLSDDDDDDVIMLPDDSPRPPKRRRLLTSLTMPNIFTTLAYCSPTGETRSTNVSAMGSPGVVSALLTPLTLISTPSSPAASTSQPLSPPGSKRLDCDVEAMRDHILTCWKAKDCDKECDKLFENNNMLEEALHDLFSSLAIADVDFGLHHLCSVTPPLSQYNASLVTSHILVPTLNPAISASISRETMAVIICFAKSFSQPIISCFVDLCISPLLASRQVTVITRVLREAFVEQQRRSFYGRLFEARRSLYDPNGSKDGGGGAGGGGAMSDNPQIQAILAFLFESKLLLEKEDIDKLLAFLSYVQKPKCLKFTKNLSSLVNSPYKHKFTRKHLEVLQVIANENKTFLKKSISASLAKLLSAVGDN